MIPVLLILFPLVGGLLTFFIRNEYIARAWSLLVSILTLAVSILGICVLNDESSLNAYQDWMPLLGSGFSVSLDGMGQILCLLNSIAMVFILVSTYRKQYTSAHNFYAAMLLTQAGMMGVFVSADALLFYFFWELALIPAYFLVSRWGGERRIPVTFKFFVYTFLGSLLMLVAIIFLYYKTPDHSFALSSFYSLKLSAQEQTWIFWMFFIAFGIKMPVFPFHTWQPDTYEQAPTATTMLLSGVMVKMGVFGIIRWLIPVMPLGSWAWGDTVSILCVIGMVYASLIAMRQDDLKRLVAYSSIAHVGLMCLAIFSTTTLGMQGVMIQMFNHGINIIGLWIVVELIERKYNTRKISELGGLATKAPVLSVFLVIIVLANIALPLTNAFIGEFMMFGGVFNSNVSKYNYAFAAIALIVIILGAVYMLNMVRRVFFGATSAATAEATDIMFNEKLILSLIVILIIVVGVYPKPFLELTQGTAESILSRMIFKHP